MTEKKSPQCVLETKADQLPLGIDFHPPDGRIYGFVYAHLLSYLAEKNPAAELQPDAPTDRLSLSFSIFLGELCRLPTTVRSGPDFNQPRHVDLRTA
jgi:hypothetical protein